MTHSDVSRLLMMTSLTMMSWLDSGIYVYKGHWEDAIFPSSYLVFLTIDLVLRYKQ
jgi:hypothetical protein